MAEPRDARPGLAATALPEMLHLRMPEIQVDAVASALERIAAVDYDAVITDIKMPGMDGVELLARIRDLRPDTPVLVITGTSATAPARLPD